MLLYQWGINLLQMQYQELPSRNRIQEGEQKVILMHIGMAETEMRGTIDLQQMIFKGVPLEKAEQKELVDIEDESNYIDYWKRSRFIHKRIEQLLMLKQNQLVPMYIMGEINGGISASS